MSGVSGSPGDLWAVDGEDGLRSWSNETIARTAARTRRSHHEPGVRILYRTSPEAEWLPVPESMETRQ